jgi:hypothetical protein
MLNQARAFILADIFGRQGLRPTPMSASWRILYFLRAPPTESIADHRLTSDRSALLGNIEGYQLTPGSMLLADREVSRDDYAEHAVVLGGYTEASRLELLLRYVERQAFNVRRTSKILVTPADCKTDGHYQSNDDRA